MKRFINYSVLLITMLLVIGILFGCASKDSSESGGKGGVSVKIGWQPSVEAPFYIAERENLFEENGIDPEIMKFTAGPPMFAALDSGSVDVTYMGTPPAVTIARAHV